MEATGLRLFAYTLEIGDLCKLFKGLNNEHRADPRPLSTPPKCTPKVMRPGPKNPAPVQYLKPTRKVDRFHADW